MNTMLNKLAAKAGLRRMSAAERLKEMPFGKTPRATREAYLERFAATRAQRYPIVDKMEEMSGHQIDRAFLDDLALHTQIVMKNSPLNYSHGRVAYT